MRILLTNDDGVQAAGLLALHQAAAELGDCEIVAPATHQSGTSHSITIHGELTVERMHIDGTLHGWGVDGKPADCVKLALRHIMKDPPDLVLSGVNAGANVGINLLYSGTVGAATEAALNGLPAIALSVHQAIDEDFPLAVEPCRRVLEALLAAELAPGQLVNVNLPNLRNGAIRGVRVTRQSPSRIRESYDRLKGRDGLDAFKLGSEYWFEEHPDGTDEQAIRDGYISVTSLLIDRTDYARTQGLSELDWPGLS